LGKRVSPGGNLFLLFFCMLLRRTVCGMYGLYVPLYLPTPTGVTCQPAATCLPADAAPLRRATPGINQGGRSRRRAATPLLFRTRRAAALFSGCDGAALHLAALDGLSTTIW